MNCIHCSTALPVGSRFCPTCGAETGDPASSPRVSLGSSVDLQERLRAALAGRYEVKELLGRGGMGAVFLATDPSLDRPVAIKVLPPDLSQDKKFYKRFEHEARTAAKLDHPHIIPIYAVESTNDLNYFVMKYVTGRTLDQLLASGPLPVDVAQRILWEASCALGHAHHRGVVHRDVKPANILIDDDGRAMVTDFGISKALESASQFTTTGQVIGTPHYMSPEQAKGIRVDGRSDQYSLGIVAYRTLAGRLPYTDDSVHTVIYKHIFEMPPPLRSFRPDAPDFIAQAVHRAIQKDPDDRFATMEEFATAVWPEHPVRSYSVSGGERGRTSLDAVTEITGAERARRRVGRTGAVVGVVLVMAAVGVAGANLLRERTGFGGAPGPADSLTVVESPPDSQVAAPPVARPETLSAPETLATASSEPARQESQVTGPPVNVPPQTPPPREPARRPAAPSVGYLTIDVINGWGSVFVDEVGIGDTPIVGHELNPGRHVVEIRREGFATIMDTVRITAGNEVRLGKTQIPREQ